MGARVEKLLDRASELLNQSEELRGRVESELRLAVSDGDKKALRNMKDRLSVTCYELRRLQGDAHDLMGEPGEQTSLF